jgi:hypothetical protein
MPFGPNTEMSQNIKNIHNEDTHSRQIEWHISREFGQAA